jgi:hypothetical protein
LLLSLGEALFPAGETERVSMHVAPDAFSLAQGIGDRSRAFHASRLALDSLFVRGVAFSASQPEYLTWAERAIQCAAPASVERCHADLALATARFNRGQFAQARELRIMQSGTPARPSDGSGAATATASGNTSLANLRCKTEGTVRLT